MTSSRPRTLALAGSIALAAAKAGTVGEDLEVLAGRHRFVPSEKGESSARL